MEKKVQARRLKGFQDYHPRVMTARWRICRIVHKESQKAGFQLIGTPALEYSEVLLGVGGETDKQVFRFLDNGQRDVALRFDLTVPFARFIAENHGSLTFPFKRLQIGSVWRAEKPQKGRYREFSQCDLDIVGVQSRAADLEILMCFHSILTELNFGPFTISVGHRGILSLLVRSALGLQCQESETKALIAIDKLDKIGPQKVCDLLTGLGSADHETVRRFMDLLHKTDHCTPDVVSQLEQWLENESKALEELSQLRADLDTLGRLSSGSVGKFRLDLSIARGLGYYTGIVFETTIDKLPGFGSICSGGRYDHLVERYLAKEFPGIGGSLGLDRFLAAMEELDLLGGEGAPTGVFLAVASAELHNDALELLFMLRKGGLCVEINLKTTKLGQQLRLANKMGSTYVLVLGAEELASKTISIKHMPSGEEKKAVPQGQIIKTLTQWKGIVLV